MATYRAMIRRSMAGRGLSKLVADRSVSAVGEAIADRIAARRATKYRPIDVRAQVGSLRQEGFALLLDDGISLNVQVDEPRAKAALKSPTVIFSHGYALNSDSFHFQRDAFMGRLRMVTYDLRGHGESERGEVSISRLAQDLGAVIDETTPEGPVILVGHSMGGMAMMALSRVRPDLVERVAGMVFVTTSAGQLTTAHLGVPGFGSLVNRMAVGASRILGPHPTLVHRTKAFAAPLQAWLVRRFSFGSDVPGNLVRSVHPMILQNDIEALADFLPVLAEVSEYEALTLWAGRPIAIVAAADDLVTPASHSEVMLQYLPQARYLRVPQAGHLVKMEHPALINRVINDVVRDASPKRRRG